MNYKYAKFHRWYKPVVANPETLFGNKIKKRALNTLQKLAENDITTEILPLSEDFLTWFIPNYKKMLEHRPNAVIHDVYANTLGNPEKSNQFWYIALKYKGSVIGGTIFRDRPDSILTAYKVYDHTWPNLNFQATPSIITEYVLAKHAYESKKDWISHGKDRNPYGINASIGLATFKLSVGYRAYIRQNHEDYETHTIEFDSIHQDTLVLHRPDNGDQISSATLITTKDNQEKYAQLLSHSDKLQINIEYYDR